MNEDLESAYSLLVSLDCAETHKHLKEAALAVEIIMSRDISLYNGFEKVFVVRCQDLNVEIVYRMLSYHKHGEKFLSEKWHRIPSLVVKIIDSDVSF